MYWMVICFLLLSWFSAVRAELAGILRSACAWGFAGAHPGRGSAGRECITRALIDPNVFSGSCEQLSLFSPPAVDNLIEQGVPPRAAVRMVREEAVQCLAKAL